jgi:hypothetical protein
MPIRHDFNSWECKYCHKIYKLELIALGCENSHGIVYVPIRKEDLQRLIQFIYTKDERLLTETLMETLMAYTSNMHGENK